MKFLIFIDFEAFWEGLGRVLKGFKEGLWTVWKVLGEGLAGVGEGLGKDFESSRKVWGGQCLGTLVWSFGLMFLNFWE